MCGISATLTRKEGNNAAEEGTTEAIDERILARGPDSHSSVCVDTLSGSYCLSLHASTLFLRAPPTPQPYEDDSGNVLLWNGELWAGELTVNPGENDTTVMAAALQQATASAACAAAVVSAVAECMAGAEGEFAFIYWHKHTETLLWARDGLGRRSLLVSIAAVEAQDTNSELAENNSGSIGLGRLDSLRLSSVIPAAAQDNDSGVFASATKWTDVAPSVVYGVSLADPTPIVPPASEATATSPSAAAPGQAQLHWCGWNRHGLESVVGLPLPRDREGDDPESLLRFLGATQAAADAAAAAPLPNRADRAVPGAAESIVPQPEDLSIPDEVLEEFQSRLFAAVGDRVNFVCSGADGSSSGGGGGSDDVVAEGVTTTTTTTSDSGKGGSGCSSDEQRPALVAVLFSGGLDSVTIARIADMALPPNQPLDLINVAFGSPPFLVPDRKTGLNSLAELRSLSDRQFNFVEVNVEGEQVARDRDHVASLIAPASTFMDLTLGSALWYAASGTGLFDGEPYSSPARVLLSGLGADELLGGYARYRTLCRKAGPEAVSLEMERDMGRLWIRNCGRDDRCVADRGVELRFPFLAEGVVGYVRSLPLNSKANFSLEAGVGDKMLLRQTAASLGLEQASAFPKRALQFGSRISKLFSGKVTGTMTAAEAVLKAELAGPAEPAAAAAEQ